jgi:hypothetical protein
MKIPTVKIVNLRNSDYFLTINQSDFDPQIHALYQEKAQKTETPKTSVEEPQITHFDPKAERKAELEAMSWRALKKAASVWGITEAPEGGWDEAIPLILNYEFPD